MSHQHTILAVFADVCFLHQSASPLSAEWTLIGLVVFRAATFMGGFENWSARFQNDNLCNLAAGVVTKAIASLSIWPRQGVCKGAALKIKL